MDFFVQQGLRDFQAAGLVGSFVVETGSRRLPAGTKQRGGGPGRGIAQWEKGARFDDLVAFAKQRGSTWHDLDTQLEFVMHEFATSEQAAYQALQQAESLEQATSAVLNQYERPANRSVVKRLKAAQQALSAYRRLH